VDAVGTAAGHDDILRRVPPQNLEAEQSVLGAIFLDNEALNQALEILNPDDFYRESHREIFRVMVELRGRDNAIDAITTTDALRSRGKLEAIGGPAYIAELAGCVPTALHVAHYAQIVRVKAALRRVALIGTELAEEACNGVTDGATFADFAEGQMRSAASRLRPKQAPLAQIASEIVETEVDWLLDGEVARRKLHDRFGDPGVGKSTHTVDEMARLTRLGKVVALLSAEDDAADTIIPRLREAGADLRLVRIIPSTVKTPEGIRSIVLPDDLPLIEKALVGVDVLYLDPITAFLAGRFDSHKDAAMRGVLAELAALAGRANCAVIWIRHLNKSSGEASALYRAGGSIAFVAAARIAFLIGYDPGDDSPLALRKRVVACVKNNLAPIGKSRAFRLVAREGAKVAHVQWLDEPCDLTANDLLTTRDPRQAEASEEADEFLRDELAEGERPSAEVERHARALGISPRTLVRARKRLGIRSRKKGFGKEWLISLPESKAAADATEVSGPSDDEEDTKL
jgi:hypothetical protein